MDGVNFSVAYFSFQEIVEGPVIQGLIIKMPSYHWNASLIKIHGFLNMEFTDIMEHVN